MLASPAGMIGRDYEWSRLVDFATSQYDQSSLGLVWGRRRIGKSLLLTSLVQAVGGLYYEAVRGSKSEALADIGRLLADDMGIDAPLSFNNWDEAISALMRTASNGSRVIVLDKYPYLREHSPELDSIIQRAFGPRNPLRTDYRCRLVLCGSAIAVMRSLLSGTAPLHGRASLDMRVSPFDFRAALDLYKIADLRTAVHVYSVIGGVAAYSRELQWGVIRIVD